MNVAKLPTAPPGIPVSPGSCKISANGPAESASEGLTALVVDVVRVEETRSSVVDVVTVRLTNRGCVEVVLFTEEAIPLGQKRTLHRAAPDIVCVGSMGTSSPL